MMYTMQTCWVPALWQFNFVVTVGRVACQLGLQQRNVSVQLGAALRLGLLALALLRNSRMPPSFLVFYGRLIYTYI